MRLLAKDHSLSGKLIWGLVILRIPFRYASLVLMLIPALRGFGAAIYLVGTSWLVAALIYVERERLSEYHIDPLFLWMFVLGKPIELGMMLVGLGLRPAAHVTPTYGGYMLAALVVAWVIWKFPPVSRRRFTTSIAGVLGGIVAGLICGSIAGFVIAQQNILLGQERLGANALLGSALSLIIYQAASAGLTEEPLFRGFLWGYLREAGWNENRILVYQAALFLLGHLEYLLIGYWGSLILIFPIGLAFGWLAKRSRAISATVVAHGVTNGLGQFIAGLLMS